VTLIIRNLNLISVQSWTYLASRGGDVERLGRKRCLVLLRDSF